MSGGLPEISGGSRALSEAVRACASAQGLELTGIAPAVTPAGYHRLLEWLDAGMHGEMGWMESRREARRHPSAVMPPVRSLVICALNYHHEPEPRSGAGTDTDSGSGSGSGARVSRYAWGRGDYHQVLRERLQPVAAVIRERSPGSKTRIVTDTAPLLERDFGRLAGLGWFGKNTMLISRRIGSWFFLGAILTDAVLESDRAEESTWCGTCTRCLDACPTQAFPSPGVLDARRCISYLTIELRHSPVPLELRAGIGEWLFGCDVCQEVCPWNRFAPSVAAEEFRPLPERNPADCQRLLGMSRAEFEAEFGGSPLERPGYGGLRRNAAIVLGNLGDERAVGVLGRALQDEEFLVRGAAAWALGRIGGATAKELLSERVSVEQDASVQEELETALAGIIS